MNSETSDSEFAEWFNNYVQGASQTTGPQNLEFERSALPSDVPDSSEPLPSAVESNTDGFLSPFLSPVVNNFLPFTGTGRNGSAPPQSVPALRRPGITERLGKFVFGTRRRPQPEDDLSSEIVSADEIPPKKRYKPCKKKLTSRTRKQFKPIEEGNNRFGKSGTRKCMVCRDRHQKVILMTSVLI